jgi:hypothetical protein
MRVQYTIEIEDDPPAIVITSSGRAELADFVQVDDFLADPRVTPGLPIVADHSQLDVEGLTSSDLREIGLGYRRLLDQLGNTPVAIVVSHPTAFGLARMAEAYAGEPEPRQRIFYDRAEALEWLRTLTAGPTSSSV